MAKSDGAAFQIQEASEGFPGGPVVKTLDFQWRGCRFNRSLVVGPKIPHAKGHGQKNYKFQSVSSQVHAQTTTMAHAVAALSQKTQIQSLGQEDPLEKEMAT